MATITKRAGVNGATYRVRVKLRDKVINSATFDTLREAKAWGVTQEALKAKGTPLDMRIAKRTLLADVLNAYAEKESITKKGGKTEIDRIRHMVDNFTVFQSPMSTLHAEDIAEFRDTRLATVAPQTIQHELKLIRQAIDFALAETRLSLPANPARVVTMPALPPSRKRRLEGDEYERLLAATQFHLYLHECIVIAVETAMRRSEILSLRPAIIDIDARYIHLPETKNGSARDVPLSSRAVPAVIRAMEGKTGDDLLFDEAPNSLTRAFRQACARACKHVYDQKPHQRRSCQPVGGEGCPGIIGLRFHDLRHEAVSRLFEKTNLKTEQIMLISGHKTYAMLRRYTHLRADASMIDALG